MLLIQLNVNAAQKPPIQSHCFIYKDSIYPKLYGYSAKLSAWDTTRQAYSQEVDNLRKEINNKYRLLLEPYQLTQSATKEQLNARLNDSDKVRYNLIVEEEDLLELRIKTYNSLLQKQYDMDIKPYIEKVDKALEQFALSNRVDFIWVMEELKYGLAYFNKSKDVSKIIVEMVNSNLK